MVGEGTNKAASMVAQLTAKHRWAVSGTPIQKGLEDLHSLIVFLGMQPYTTKSWWRQCIALPYENNVREAKGRNFEKILSGT
jgi:E3 ubiquitin-protein ligase SHPRH